MDIKTGEYLVKKARQTIKTWVLRKRVLELSDPPKELDKKHGIFVSIHTYPKEDLRGCIGFPEPVNKLSMLLVEAALSATMDPRFPELDKSELGKVVVEVSVLTEPEKIDYKDTKDLLNKIKIKKDGIILKSAHQKALYLPQVWEHFKTKEAFLDSLAAKAGLNEGAWRFPGTEFYRFHVQAFKEKEPKGKVVKA